MTQQNLIDPRGPRFGAAITTLVLAAALSTTPSSVATILIAIQTVVFGLGAFVGLGAQPYGVLFRTLIRPRLKPPVNLEASQPPQFAQLVGFIFAAVALIGALIGATAISQIAVGGALAAAFLNAAFGYCLGCEMYLIGKRIIS